MLTLVCFKSPSATKLAKSVEDVMHLQKVCTFMYVLLSPQELQYEDGCLHISLHCKKLNMHTTDGFTCTYIARLTKPTQSSVGKMVDYDAVEAHTSDTS